MIKTGIEATKAIREMGYRNLIIGVTGNSMLEELQEFSHSGADLVLVKPLLGRTVDRLIDLFIRLGVRSVPGCKLELVSRPEEGIDEVFSGDDGDAALIDRMWYDWVPDEAVI